MNNMKVLGVITARGGSKGLKEKNILPLLGKPVIYYTIRKALRSKLINRLVLSTEDERIARISNSYGVEIIKRPKKLAMDSSAIENVLRQVVKFMERKDYIPDLIVLLYANVPVRSDTIIDKAIRKIIRTKADAVISVTDVGKYHPYWLLRIDQKDKFRPFISEKPYNYGYRRQELPQLYIHDGAVLVVRKAILMKNLAKTKLYSCFGNNIRVIYQKPEETVDIDNWYDLKLAEILLREKQKIKK